MYRDKYKRRIKIVTIIFTLCFFSLIGTTLSKVGVFSMNTEDFNNSRKIMEKIKDDKVYYEKILGNIYDQKGTPILINNKVINDSSLKYDKSYSHLLGNVHIYDNGLLNNNLKTLTSDDSLDSKENKGYSITLTINNDLQTHLYSLTEGTRSSIVVLKRHTGEILSLTSTYVENFNLSGKLTEKRLKKYNSGTEPLWLPEYLNNYPPGSCQKIFTSALGFEANLGNYTINDTGEMEFGEGTIPNYNCYAYGDNLDINTAFCVSANTYFSSLLSQIPNGTISKYSSDMLLNSTIKTDFGTITNSFPLKNLTEFQKALLAIGQGNELSSIGMAMMVQGCIDNEIYRPHTIKNICYEDEKGKRKTKSLTKEEVLSSNFFTDDTCKKVQNLMTSAANHETYSMSENIVGAKSGTADIIVNEKNINRASLIGFNEKYIVVVSTIQSEKFGISNKEIMEDIFSKLNYIS